MLVGNARQSLTGTPAPGPAQHTRRSWRRGECVVAVLARQRAQHKPCAVGGPGEKLDKERLKALGMGAFASYGVISNVNYGTALT